jgi:hypothetical protein
MQRAAARWPGDNRGRRCSLAGVIQSVPQAIVGSVSNSFRPPTRRRPSLRLLAVPTRSLTRPAARRADRRSARIVAAAARWIQDGRRLDMQGLAGELGISRVTLFRRIGSRVALLGKAWWLLTQCTL